MVGLEEDSTALDQGQNTASRITGVSWTSRGVGVADVAGEATLDLVRVRRTKARDEETALTTAVMLTPDQEVVEHSDDDDDLDVLTILEHRYAPHCSKAGWHPQRAGAAGPRPRRLRAKGSNRA